MSRFVGILVAVLFAGGFWLATAQTNRFDQPVPVPTHPMGSYQPPTTPEIELAPEATQALSPASPVEASSVETPVYKAASSVKQGEVLRVTITDPGGSVEGGKAYLAGRDAQVFKDSSEGRYFALASVDVYQKPGGYKLAVQNAKGETLYTQPVEIIDPKYPTQNIRVTGSTAGLKPLPGELEAVGALKTRLTQTRFWEEPFISPTTDCQNSLFGVKRLHNGKPSDDYHKGVDLKSPSGRPIRATNAGVVVISKMYRLHGGTVGLDHGQGVTSIYIHMSKMLVKEGDSVKKGDIIGHVGSTGFATGPHLHWGLYVSGIPVNPHQFVSGVPRC